MRQTIQGAVIIGAVVAAGVSVLLAQSATWTTPRDVGDGRSTDRQPISTAQFRDNLLWLRQDAELTGTAALVDLGCGTLGTNEVLFSDCSWATIPDFDLHDTVTQSATIADPDRLAFSDEGSAGDPMRYTTALNLAGYVLSDDSVGPDEMDPDSATAGQVMIIGSGGNPEWGDLPTTTVVALDMGETTTTATHVSKPLGRLRHWLRRAGKRSPAIYQVGQVSRTGGNATAACQWRVYNSTTTT